MAYKVPIELYRVIGDAVESIRATGNITSVIPNGSNWTYSCANSLRVGEYITLHTPSSIITDLQVLRADSIGFDLSVNHNATKYFANAPYFMHEKQAKAGSVLTEKTGQDTYMYQKYPLVLLVHPYVQEHDSVDYAYSVDCSIILITSTESSDWSDDRYDKNIMPILRPIQERLIEAICNSPYSKVQQANMLEYSWSDLLFIDGNPFPDKMDGVVLSIKGLQIIDTFC